jgi:sulfopyruvate decarboxylase subunit alpha
LDRRVVDALENAGCNFACSLPCGMISGILKEISSRRGMVHVAVTREEEGVGVCAGAYLGGSRPSLLMQNSGLGNSINALLSLTKLYRLGLFVVMAYRGRRGEEEVEAQIPMGEATTKLVSLLGARYSVVERAEEVGSIETLARRAFKGEICAVLLTPRLWGDS